MERQFTDGQGGDWKLIRRTGGGFAPSGEPDDPDGSWAGLEFRNLVTGETRLLRFPRGGVPRAFSLERMPETELRELLAKAVAPEDARTEEPAPEPDAAAHPKRTNFALREAIDHLLDHMRYVNRHKWSPDRQQVLVLANQRCDHLVDEIWKVILEQKHPGGCPCELCHKLRAGTDAGTASGPSSSSR